MKKGSVLPLVLVLATLVLMLAFYLKTKNTGIFNPGVPKTEKIQEVESKIYKNEKYNFSLTYPTGWEVKQYQDFAADFSGETEVPNEATPQAILIRFSASDESFDKRGYEKIEKLDPLESFLEVLDVRSTITKIRNFEVANFPAIEYIVERNFSAPQGPRKEFRQVVEILKEDSILRFQISASTLEELEKSKETLNMVISSIAFN